MSDTPEQNAPEQETAQTAGTPKPVVPILLTAQEIDGILMVLRKLPMEQVEGLVANIRNQYINFTTAKTGEPANV